MSLLVPITDFLLAENAKHPIDGEVLYIGHQQVFGKDPGIKHKVLDQSDYEGAEIIWDLGYPVPETLQDRFDFIYNGGCLDNMFNPAQALMNFTQMLKPRGRLVCMESASSFNSPYLMYSPAWFWDYFDVNHFVEWKVYICSYRNAKELMYGPWKWFEYDRDKDKNGPAPETRNNHVLVVSCARKGAHTTHDVQPIQYQYRKDAGGFKMPSSLVHKVTDALGLTLYKSNSYLRPVERFE